MPLLIPVLTTFGLPFGYMGDIVGSGFILSLASFLVAVAALETGSPYAQLGASRAKTFGAITEPVILFVVFTVALITGTDLPYALATTVRSSASQIIRPAHLLEAAALFMVILCETGRIPVDTYRDERVRDDRGSPGVRALRALLRAAAVGLGDEAADPLHDPARRVRGAVGPRRVGAPELLDRTRRNTATASLGPRATAEQMALERLDKALAPPQVLTTPTVSGSSAPRTPNTPTARGTLAYWIKEAGQVRAGPRREAVATW